MHFVAYQNLWYRDFSIACMYIRQVKLSNLIEPTSKSRLRRVDREHVQTLKDSFTVRSEIQTIFCDNITGSITKQSAREHAMRKNAIKVEVIDWNHTRISLQELANEGKATEYTFCIFTST